MFLKQLEEHQENAEAATLMQCMPNREGVRGDEQRVAYAAEARTLAVVVARIQEAAHAQ